MTFLFWLILFLLATNGLFSYLWVTEKEKSKEYEDHANEIKEKIKDVKNEDKSDTIDDLVDQFNIDL